jgi:rhomboid protease GluP
MSSLLESTQPTALADEAQVSQVLAAEAAPDLVISYDEQLRLATRRTPVTWMLVAANVAAFAVMAISHGRLFHINPHVLLTWGGGIAPRVFGDQWWRAATYMFVHGDLAHLAGNLLFLLLIAPLVERLLGPWRFALAYLFAGLGGGLLAMGTMPQGVLVGASAAIAGVYGALLGCSLRGPRSIPWRMIAQRAGLLLLFTAVSLLCEWLDVARQPVAHLGGSVFGVAAGLLGGHRLQPRAARRRWWGLAVVVAVCVGLIGLTAWGVYRCTTKARSYYARYAPAKDRERELLGRFQDALHRWERGEITGAEWKQLLEKTLVPALQEARSSCGLKFTGDLADLEKQPLSMQDYWKDLRATRGEPKSHDEKPLTIEEYGKAYSLLWKVRVDTWRALADDLPGNHALMLRAILDEHELNLLCLALDDEVNEDNLLFRWFELKRTGHHSGPKAAEEADQGLIKNRGFEDGLEGWSRNNDDPHIRIEFDTDIVREGRQALRVTAPHPADIGLYQEVLLKPGRWYRFSGWVRTRGLDPHGSSVYGTFHIHARAINDFIAKGPNHGSDTEWTKVSLTFQARGDGLTRICLFVVGFGRGTGTAWFDDLKVVEVSGPNG